MSKLIPLMVFALAAFAQPAQARIAEVVCEDRDTLRTRLESQFGAQLNGLGMRDPETMLEIWSEPASGNWTLIQTYAGGHACIVAMGTHWENLSTEKESS